MNWVFGFHFESYSDNYLVTYLNYSDPTMVLPEPRMMHQSCIVKGKDGEPVLLVVGGKTGPIPMESKYTNSVLGFNLKHVLEGKEAGHKWESLAPMKEARANFMLTVVDNKVYVYGGIKGNSTEAGQTHLPELNEVLCEVYDPVENTWTEVTIENGAQLAAFGYTQL